MRRLTNLMAVVLTVAAMAVISTSCNKSKELDVEGIQKVIEKRSAEITESDIDFILDQMEIVVNKTKGMTPEERKEYSRQIDKKESGTIVALAIMCDGYYMTGKLTDKQRERFDELKKLSKQ